MLGNGVLSEKLNATLDTLPRSPGVYVFRDAAGAVLYVGKARSLRSRVRSYFQPGSSDVRAFVARLSAELADLETFVTDTEKEAALLENQLIKQHQPRYNVKLRDDKEFLSLRLNPQGTWPRLEVVRRPRPDGAHYFGPYDSATATRQTLRLVNRHFQLRTCTDTELKSRNRPCLQYQIKRCPAPCVKDVSAGDYGAHVRNVALFLSGRHEELIENLKERMLRASSQLEYEQAARHRDQLRAIERVQETQRVSTVRDTDQDVVGYYREADRAEVTMLRVRSGKLVGVYRQGLKEISVPDDELIASFIVAYYERGADIPDEVIVPLPIEADEGISQTLSEQRGRRTKLLVPKRGSKKKLSGMAMENASHAFREKRRAQEDMEARLRAIQHRLRLPRLPLRIECVDISHTGGQDAVAAIVALTDGIEDRSRYRTFRIKSARGGDDYGAMYETLSRRFRRGRDGEAGWELPDVLVVDGGKGQLGVARAALLDLEVRDLPVVALAKEKENVAGDTLVDRVYLPEQKNAIPLRSDPALTLLARARDEAHRCSNAFRKKIANRRTVRSELDNVPGVGPKTRAKLLKALGSLRAVKAASEAKLIDAGATTRQAKAIVHAFGAMGKSSAAKEAEEHAIENAFHRA